jgi:hypothetical protein
VSCPFWRQESLLARDGERPRPDWDSYMDKSWAAARRYVARIVRTRSTAYAYIRLSCNSFREAFDITLGASAKSIVSLHFVREQQIHDAILSEEKEAKRHYSTRKHSEGRVAEQLTDCPLNTTRSLSSGA